MEGKAPIIACTTALNGKCTEAWMAIDKCSPHNYISSDFMQRKGAISPVLNKISRPFRIINVKGAIIDVTHSVSIHINWKCTASAPFQMEAYVIDDLEADLTMGRFTQRKLGAQLDEDARVLNVVCDPTKAFTTPVEGWVEWRAVLPLTVRKDITIPPRS